MSVETRIKERAVKIEQALDRLIPQEPLPQGEIVEAMRYSLLGGGKYLRPVLLLEWNAICGGRAEETLPFACALEMIHTYSLVHDDLPSMDNDDLRRGRPSCHKAFGEGLAVLTGDALLNRAFEVMLNEQSGLAAETRLRAAGYMARMAGVYGMIGGQTIDISACKAPRNEAELMHMVRLKTGALIKAACACGALLASCDEQTLKLAEEYAELVGLAFQIKDDLLDQGTESRYTFVDAYGAEGCERAVWELTDQAAALCDKLPGSVFLRDLTLWMAGRDH